MSDISYSSAAPDGLRFTIGRALSLSFGVLGRNFGPMALLSIVILGIEATIKYVMAEVMGSESGGAALGLISYAFITAPVTYATFQDLRGTGAKANDLFSRGFNRAGRVLGVTFALSVVIAVPALLAFALSGIAGMSLVVPFAAAGVFALYVFVVWFVAIPVQVVEDTKFFRGFGRASALGRGRRWALLGLLLVYFAMVAVLLFVMGMIVYLGPDSDLFITALAVPFGACYSVFGAILPAVVYYLLRAEKEGVGIDEIAKVFD
jgi:hypothetical protein